MVDALLVERNESAMTTNCIKYRSEKQHFGLQSDRKLWLIDDQEYRFTSPGSSMVESPSDQPAVSLGSRAIAEDGLLALVQGSMVFI